MKKFTILASLIIAMLGFKAQAQEETLEIYVTGAFNNYQEQPEWILHQDEEAAEIGMEVFRGYYEIPEGQFELNFSFSWMKFVPAVVNDEGEVTWSSRNVKIFEDGYFFSGPAAAAGGLVDSRWVCDNWSGGGVEIVLDITDMEHVEVVFSADAPVEELWYVRGAFNDYDPAGESAWALYPSPNEEENGVYIGSFEIKKGEFSFNLMDPYGTVWIPFEIDTVEVEFTDNVYETQIDYALYDEDYFLYWENSDWEGGIVTLRVDANTGEFTITHDQTSVVSGVEAAEEGQTVVYNLQGQRVNNLNGLKGLYIVNGKKVIL